MNFKITYYILILFLVFINNADALSMQEQWVVYKDLPSEQQSMSFSQLPSEQFQPKQFKAGGYDPNMDDETPTPGGVVIPIGEGFILFIPMTLIYIVYIKRKKDESKITLSL